MPKKKETRPQDNQKRAKELRHANAGWRDMLPRPAGELSEQERQKELAQIKEEINHLNDEIEGNREKATKLIFDAVWYAKRIGDKLRRVKELLPGSYQQWVLENFH